MASVTVCMGSSCFSRGSSSNAEVVQDFIEKHSLLGKVDIRGCLCESNCKDGPILKINEKVFTQVSPEALPDLLAHELGVTE